MDIHEAFAWYDRAIDNAIDYLNLDREEQDKAWNVIDKFINEAIARQSVKSEEVAEAIEWHKNCLQYYKDEDKEIRSHYGGNLPSWVVESIKASDVSITALQAYQPTTRKNRIVEEVVISKTETTKMETVEQCEWCKGKDFKVNPCGNGDYGIQAFLMKKGIIILQRHHALGYFDISFCPNCGRDLNAKH